MLINFISLVSDAVYATNIPFEGQKRQLSLRLGRYLCNDKTFEEIKPNYKDTLQKCIVLTHTVWFPFSAGVNICCHSSLNVSLDTGRHSRSQTAL